jgi:hypothetical protein
MLEANPRLAARGELPCDTHSPALQNKYHQLSECIKKEETLTKLLMRIGYEKNVLGKERKVIKKNRNNGTKVHKYFIERKK